jgi:maleylacetoacetate isomerase
VCVAFQYGLYSYWRSGASYRVRIALAHKGIPYKYHAISLLKGEQASGEYAKLNPQHKVPLLVWDENGQARSLAQSIAIIDYLETAHPDKPSLLPKDPCQNTRAGRNCDIWGMARCKQAPLISFLFSFLPSACCLFVAQTCVRRRMRSLRV